MGKITVTTTDNKTGKKTVNVSNTKPRAKISKNVKAYVKKAISAEAEDKYAQLLFGPYDTRGSGINSTATSVGATGRGFTYQLTGQVGVSIIPGLSQGEQSGQRIGEKIRVKKCMLHYLINAHPLTTGDAGSNTCPASVYAGKPFKFVMFVYYRKDARDLIANDSLLDVGQVNNTLTYATDLLKPINTNKFKILGKRVFNMYPNQNRDTQGSNITYSQLNDVEGNYKPFVMGKLKIKLPKILRYEGTNSQPFNNKVYIAYGCVNMDGSSIDDAHFRANGSFSTHLYYEDS